jgi:hypothetical protein
VQAAVGPPSISRAPSSLWDFFFLSPFISLLIITLWVMNASSGNSCCEHHHFTQSHWCHQW